MPKGNKTEKESILKYLQNVAHRTSKEEEEVERVLEYIKNVIRNETEKTNSTNSEAQKAFDPTLLNVALREYYKLIEKFKLIDDTTFGNLPLKSATKPSNADLHLIYAMLLVKPWNSSHDTELEMLNTFLEDALKNAIEANRKNVLILLRTLNLLHSKFVELKLPDIQLNEIYHLMQMGQQGLREEILVLFKRLCENYGKAQEYFNIIINNWPWTNRHKLYLLSCILTKHNLLDLLKGKSEEGSNKDFFEGLRLSLSYKKLLPASQYLVGALSNQKSGDLLELSSDILLNNGNRNELKNFHAQWFGRISEKDRLFEKLRQNERISSYLSGNLDDISENNINQFRIVLTIYLFSKQILSSSEVLHSRICLELMKNCSSIYEFNVQLCIYKLVTENLASLDTKTTLEFYLEFMKRHKTADNAHDRHEILNRIPIIINFIAKTFKAFCRHSRIVGSPRSTETSSTDLEQTVIDFFHALQSMINEDIESDCYQLKIFSLKLLEILLKSVYSTECLERNTKNFDIGCNKNLGEFLKSRKIFVGDALAEKCLSLLNDPSGYEDATEILVSILQKLQYPWISTEAMKICQSLCERKDLDECSLTGCYAKVVCFQQETSDDLWSYASKGFSESVHDFKEDPLDFCKKKGHLFGYLYSLNEVLSSENRKQMDYMRLLDHLENTVADIIAKLSMINSQTKKDEAGASFQDMDESLRLLIKSSAFKVEETNYDDTCRLLLLSFWLTLKACCDLATNIGDILLKEDIVDVENLKRCLQISVEVLTRCRHKGAIEAAGLSIGKLTKSITSKGSTQGMELLYACLNSLFEDNQMVSTTRRGAGFSIMFLHIIKNEENGKMLMNYAIHQIMNRLRSTQGKNGMLCSGGDENKDRKEALLLHYLCVLIKDAYLRDFVTEYYSEIMLIAMAHIDHTEWTICNAALQLFGALVPKILGQRQATEFEDAIEWESSEVTYEQIRRMLPKIIEHIHDYCKLKYSVSSSTRSIVLFMSFLSKVDYLKHNTDNETINSRSDEELLIKVRELAWSLLRHRSQIVRELAALCFVRSHALMSELPELLIRILDIIFNVNDEDFYDGLLLALKAGWRKITYECQFVMEKSLYECFIEAFRKRLIDNFKFKQNFTLYTKTKTLDLLILTGIDFKSNSIVFQDFLDISTTSESYNSSIFHDIWTNKLKELTVEKH